MADSIAKAQKKVIDVVLVSLLLTLNACNVMKKETPTQVFSCEFCEFFKNTFFHRTPLGAPSICKPVYIASYKQGLFLDSETK